MQQSKYWPGKLAEAIDTLEGRNPAGREAGSGNWLAQLKQEMAERRLAEIEAQYRRDALMTNLVARLNKVRAVELLEEMNRELLDKAGAVEPVFTVRHELCLRWPAQGGRHQISVAADYDEATNGYYLLVTGKTQQRLPVTENDLKKALVNAFREPHFDNCDW
jgi:hypothetical protein